MSYYIEEMIITDYFIKTYITKEPQSYFDYEIANNETKRVIKLLKPDFVGTIEKEFRRIISDTL